MSGVGQALPEARARSRSAAFVAKEDPNYDVVFHRKAWFGVGFRGIHDPRFTDGYLHYPDHCRQSVADDLSMTASWLRALKTKSINFSLSHPGWISGRA